jgi:hypothetical protein
MEVAGGVSIDAIRDRLQGGGKKQESSGNGTPKSANGSSQSGNKHVPRISGISRKKWSTDDLFNRLTPGAKAGSGTPPPPRELTPLQKAAQKLEAADGSEVILKKFFKAGYDDLLVSPNEIFLCSVFVGLSSSCSNPVLRLAFFIAVFLAEIHIILNNDREATGLKNFVNFVESAVFYNIMIYFIS